MLRPFVFHVTFPYSKRVIEAINKIQRNFLWCGYSEKIPCALVSWDLIQLPKILGGLSVGNLYHKNLALLLKWVCQYLHESGALWRKVI